MVFDSLLNPILGPLLALDPLYSILILSFAITFLITLAYKYLTDQDEMKRLKDKMKSYQDKMKEVQKEDPDKAMDMQKEAMSVNMEYMKKSFKPTLYTFIPIIIIFGWMNAHLAYHPIQPGQPFNVTAQMQSGLPDNIELSSVPELDIREPVKAANETVKWTVSGGEAGEYTLRLTYGDNEFTKDILIDERNYNGPSKDFDGPVRKVRVGMEEVHPLGGFSIFGWNPGWLGTYIIFSIIMSIGLRKVLGVA